MNLDVVKAWVDLALGFAAVVAVVVGFVRWGNRSLEAKILTELREATSQVRKDANGGQSLNDLHKKVDQICERQAEILKDVTLLKDAVIHLEDEVDGIGRRRDG